MESAQNSQPVQFYMILGVFLMYISSNADQITIEDFFMPFGGKLLKTNRWVKLASIMPWEHIEQIYMASFQSERGRPAISSRIAFGAIFIKENDSLTDEGTVAAIAENPYMQYFLGLTAFQAEPLFDPSMMVHFRKRFPVEEVAKINEYICTGVWPDQQRNVDLNDTQEELQQEETQQDENQESNQEHPSKSGKRDKNTSKKKLKREKKQKKNRGKLIMDATVAPADIKYPTDIDLLNKSREHLETAVDILWKEVPHKGHKLPYSPKKARKSYLSLAKSKKWTEAKCRTAIGDQLRCIQQATKRLEELEVLVPDYEKRFPAWLHRRLEVIPLVYAQQKGMYDNHTHTCEDRIVSLEQPHVRPIQRGKRPNPTEFGQKLHLSVVDGFTYLEQTCWSNFNEGCDLAAVEDYYRKFGCYPEAVLADKIYQTRANRAFCKEKGIRLTGPALGRPKAGEADRKQKRQMYKDACDRNAVEGRNGNAKRRFGLDLIAAKLDETAKTEAALILTAMNAAHRLARWLLRFFADNPFLQFLQFLWLPAGNREFFQ